MQNIHLTNTWPLSMKESAFYHNLMDEIPKAFVTIS